MRGVILVVSVLLGALATPAILVASERTQAPPAAEATPSPPTAEVPPAAEPPLEPAPSVTEYAKERPEQAEADDEYEPAAPIAGAEREPTRSRRPARRRGEGKPASAAAVRTVAMRDIEFKPRRITIDRGDTVRWRNEDRERHNAIGENGTFDTPLIGKGETSQHTFNRAGKFPYFCSIHEGMTATLRVRGAGSGDSGGSGSGGGDSGGSGSASSGTGEGSASGGASGTGSGGSGLATGGSFGSSASTEGFESSGTDSGGRLPATGQELPWLALAGAALLALGAALRTVVSRVR